MKKNLKECAKNVTMNIYKQEQERKLKEKMRIEEERKKLEIQRKKEEERRYKEEQRLKIKKQEEERKQREVALSKAFINKNNNILSLYTTFVVNMQNENIILNNELKDILWNFLCRNYNQFVFQSDLDYQLYKEILIEMKIDINIEEYINSNFNQFFKYLLSLRETKELYQKSYDSKRWDNKYVNKNVQLKILNRMIKCYKKYTENEDDGNSNEVYLITLLYFASIYISLQGDILQPTSSKEKILTFEIDYTKFSELGDNDKIKYLV